MKKILFLFCTLILAISAKAGDASFSFGEMKIKAGGTATIAVCLTNDEIVKGLSIDISLPEGLSFVSGNIVNSSRIPAGFSQSGKIQTSGALRIAGLGIGQYIEAGEGEIFSFQVKAEENVPIGTIKIHLSGMKIAVASKNITLADRDENIKVYTEYQVALSVNDEKMGTVTGGGLYENGTTANLSATPGTGYHFVKWSDDSEENPRSIVVNSEVAFTALFAPNQYTLSFNTDGGTAIADITQDFTTAVTKPADPTKTGYTFSGWDKEIPATMPAENMTFKALYTRIVVELDEESTTAPTVSEPSAKIIVKRTIKAGEWGTICLPFAMTGDQVKSAFGDGVMLGSFSGCETITDSQAKVIGIKVKFENAESVEANHPYIIKVTGEDINMFEVEDAALTPAEAPSVEMDKKEGKSNRFIGTYNAKTLIPANNLFLSGGDFWYSTGKTEMMGFRAYFDFCDILSGMTNASSRIQIQFEGGTTDMPFVVDHSSGIDNKLYNLSGSRATKPGKGLYILNGKLIIKH